MASELIKASDIVTAIAAIDEGITVDAALGECVNRYRLIGDVVREAQRIKREAEAHLIEVMEVNGDGERPAEIVIGDTRYYVGIGADKKYIPRNGDTAIIARLLEHGGVDAVALCLVSSPWKQSQVRELLGETEHDELFIREETDRLKEGKPKRIKAVDERFIPRKIGGDERNGG